MTDMPREIWAAFSNDEVLRAYPPNGPAPGTAEKYIRASELAKAYEAIRDLAASAEHHGYAVYPMEKHAAIIKTAREQGK